VSKRGLDRETVEKFGIGYAPNSWNDVLRRFGGTEEARRALSDLGLIVERERGQIRDGDRHYDRFRDRIMFPIRDSRGRIIAFGGRVLDQGEPKYLNSPETVLFHKGSELYALFETRRARTNLKRLLVVEGYMDAVRLHQYGINYAVATLGTATTPEHMKRMFRVVSEVVFAFDGDRAGRAAAWRALQHALPEARQGREIRFLFLPDGHDPDSLVGEEGAEAFEHRLDATLPLSEYFVRELSERSDLSSADGRAHFSENARPLWAKLPDGVYRELMLARIAEVVGIGPQRLQELWASGHPGMIAAPTLAAAPQKRVPVRNVSGGRGSLVRQAVLRLVSYPAIAQEVTGPERNALEDSEEPGIELLRDLIDNLSEHPAQNSAQVIERWADKPGGEALEKLLQREHLVADAVTAAQELHGALDGLARRVVEERMKALEDKSRNGALLPDELEEYQRLSSIRRTRDGRGG
jgi:DNA primase